MSARPGEPPFDQIRSDVAEKVRKLLNQAEDPAATPEEAQAFTAKAQQLMSKYAIDLAMVTQTDRTGRVEMRSWRIEGPYAGHKVSLVTAVARSNDCRAVYTPLAGGARHIDAVGYRHDLDWVHELYRSLELQLTLALAGAQRAKPDHVHGRTYAVGFVHGFVDEVAARLASARRAAVAEAEARTWGDHPWGAQPSPPGTGATTGSSAVALVLVAKSERVDDEYRVRFPGARTVRRYTRLGSWSGYQPGRQAGRDARLARAAVGARRRLPA